MIAISCVGPFFVTLKESELFDFFPKACLDLSRKLKFKRTDKYVVIRLDGYFASSLKNTKIQDNI